MCMEVVERKSSSGYDKPPWLFKGSALYQLHLVKAETAQAFIPKEFKLVEAFGYTLGGFFLAHYDDSPAGMFDELVVIAGIVWNPPTSCAWAARVLVNSQEACVHGRKYVGLPSQVAGFSKRITAISKKPTRERNSFLNMIGMGSSFHNTKNQTDIEVTEFKGSAQSDFCSIKFPSSVPESISDNNWMGPAVKISLPSFSGRTEYNPELLKYSCQIECRVRPVKPAKVSASVTRTKTEKEATGPEGFVLGNPLAKGLVNNDACERSISVLLSKPVLALEFNFLKMQVEAPTSVTHSS